MSRFKKSTLGLMLLPFCAFAVPQGSHVISGDFKSVGTPTGIEIIASDGTIIEWDQFSIAEGESVHFNLPNPTSTVLCRVQSEDKTTISGKLTSNGAIYLINQNGFLIEPTSFISSNDLSFSSSNAESTIVHLGSTESLGSVKISSNGKVVNNGSIKAHSVFLEGDIVHLKSKSFIDVSHESNSGEVYVGGGWQGNNPLIHNANTTIVDKGAKIVADAIHDGNGGTVVIWAESSNTYFGEISAKGAGLLGKGGQVEVSSRTSLNFDGDVNVAALSGIKGTLLLDPVTITIQDVNPNIDGKGKGHDITYSDEISSPYDYSTVHSIITAHALNKLLKGNVDLTLAAFDKITVNAIIHSTGPVSSFTLNAPIVDLNRPIILHDGGILLGTANIINVGPHGIIQNAVDIAEEGATINLDSAIYTQQVNIDGVDVTLNGSGTGNTFIVCPSYLTNYVIYMNNGDFYKPVILIENAFNVNIQDLTVDGNDLGSNFNDKFTGIVYHNAGGTVSNVYVTKVQDSFPAGMAQRGYGVVGLVDTGLYTLNILDSNFDHFQKSAILASGLGLNFNISGNSISGSFPSSLATAHGIIVQEGASGTISTNTINKLKSLVPGMDSFGILADGSGYNLNIVGNTIRGSNVGIGLFNCLDNATVNYNNCSGNSNSGILVDSPQGQTNLGFNVISHNENQGMYFVSASNLPFNLSGNIFVSDTEGLVIQGSGNAGPVVTFNGDVFSSIADKYIQLIGDPNDTWDSTETVTFDGLVFGEMSYLQYLGLLYKIVDSHNDASLGTVVEFVPPTATVTSF